jgi:hypothetical protein
MLIHFCNDSVIDIKYYNIHFFLINGWRKCICTNTLIISCVVCQTILPKKFSVIDLSI